MPDTKFAMHQSGRLGGGGGRSNAPVRIRNLTSTALPSSGSGRMGQDPGQRFSNARVIRRVLSTRKGASVRTGGRLTPGRI